MPEANDTQPPKPAAPENSILGGLKPDELFARGMQSVKMTGAGGLAEWTPPTLEEAARLFPNYDVIEIIGRGGMGAVYKARQLALDRIVAIKLLPLEISADRDFAERFKREARTMAKMNHPNIVAVFDFGTTAEGHLFFVMEFVEGTTLHHLIKSTGLKPPQTFEIIVGVCEALNYAHTEGVVHRDVKPANVLVDVRGRVKVTDFGLARFNSPSAAEQAGYTMTGTVLGTPDYMAPEQKRGMHVDHRADIYSLGVMLYEMLCGHVPQGVFDLPSRLISVDERVDQVVSRAMQQEPNRRYQNTAEMKHEVQTIRLAKDPNAKAPRPRDDRTARPGGKRAPLAIGIAAAAAVAIAAVVFSKPGKPPIEPKPAPAEAAVNIVKPPDVPVIAKTPEPEVKSPEPKPPVAPPVTPPVAPPEKPPVATTPPPVAPPIPPRPPVEVPPLPNPELANTVAQLGPNTQPPNPIPSREIPDTGSGPVLQEWERLADRGDALVKKRDPEGAIEAFDQALDAAKNSATPVPRIELARLCYKVGSLEAGLGETATARGSLEYGKQLLLEERKGGKMDAVASELLGKLEAALRKLPRQ